MPKSARSSRPAVTEQPMLVSVKKVVNARADTVDFRDRMFVPTLIEVGTHVPMQRYLEVGVPILDQGREGACTGFALATVAHYLLRTRAVDPDRVPVSPHMLYRMARQHDEWPGETYSGSSARGAMKGWHKHGVCSAAAWPKRLRRGEAPGLNEERTGDALCRPLGAYFRVNHRDLVAMHAALSEVGILYATAGVHGGWDEVGADGVIPFHDGLVGGHAFAIVAYDSRGFWLQNSWGALWGRHGFGFIGYDDWLANGTDVWVARLGVPVQMRARAPLALASAAEAAGASRGPQARLRPFVISVDNDGRLQPGGDYGMSPADLKGLFDKRIAGQIQRWGSPRVLLYAHGGLVSEAAALQRLAEYVSPLMEAQVYPLAFAWHSDYWSTLGHILQDAMRRRRSEGVLDAAKDFLLDRVDDALEPLARGLTGRAAWNEMKENAAGTSIAGHAADLVVRQLVALKLRVPGLEIHLAGHSAGSVLQGALLRLLADARLKAQTCTLWAPACTMALFEQQYVPALKSGTLQRLTVYALDDRSEQDDHCARIYNKSLLYLVAHAFESRARVPWVRPDGTPLLGMQKFHAGNKSLQTLVKTGRAQIVIAPNSLPVGHSAASRARAHGDFDDDAATVQGTFARILEASAQVAAARSPARARGAAAPKVRFERSASSLQAQRQALDRGSR